MKLIVGLGNPGKQYQATRHNIGWQVLALLANRHGQGPPQARFNGEIVQAQINTTKSLLLSPLTYMNASGNSVRPASDFYDLPHDDIVIVCDDINLPLGTLRFRAKGSAGGQKGLKDILQQLGSQEIPRLRIGIGQPPPRWDTADYVLGKFTSDEQVVVQQAVERAGDAIADWVEHDATFCMNKYNTTNNH
ncbi:MAG: aminoacyl-tRNA hydrolase [Planctomycetota bacterium]|nr:aminoacyl-tRNA hydrolase [Planctomycetota bacterium]